MPACLLALGSNLGDPSTLLEAAQHQLACLPATRLLAASPLLETAAVGGPPGQQSFLNSSILLQTQLEGRGRETGVLGALDGGG